MNHYGVAREASAIYDVELKPVEPKLPTPKVRRTAPPNISGPLGMTSLTEQMEAAAATLDTDVFPIVIDDAQGCARYTARIIRNVKIGPSPRADRQAAGTARLALHQQRRRRDQLRAQRAWPSHARLRSRPAGRRHDHRAPRPRRRSAEDARRRGPQAHDRRPRHRRREEAGRTGGRDGRLRLDDHRAGRRTC